ncbi:TonB-dependent receptor family protein [Noviherbaspirillum malthae]|uniref:TonB-dependent receptor family protein n=1 Tax=Noviherbaspirillum malthae TaxID=1260987 RepID=UPI00188FF94C|nr:TonB-dependent receptor [Noviherbaspirillum malthae]
MATDKSGMERHETMRPHASPMGTEGGRAGAVRWLFPALCALQAVSAQAQVQAQEQVLPAVTVTAPPVESATLAPITEAARRIAATPGGANIVDAEQYKEGRVSTLSDALQFSPGVFVAPRFGAEEARLSIRGSGLQRTFHMRGIQLLQDGVPLNLADGSADFQAVEPLSARYVEVYRGANALQYGSTTLGGAVNFISPSGLSSPAFGARVEAGSFDYRRAQASTGGHSDSADWFLAGSVFHQDGFRAHARQNTRRVSGNLGWQLGDDVETRFFLNAVRSNSELPGALTGAEMRTDPRRADPATVAGDQHRDFDLVRLSNRTGIILDADQRLEFGAFYSYKSLFHPIFQVLEQDSDDYGVSARYVGKQTLFGRKNQLVVGASLAAGRLEDDRFRNVGGQPGARTGESEQRSSNTTVFAENQHYLLPSTALVTGLQAVNATRKLEDRFLSDGDNSVDARFRHVSPKLGVRQDLDPKTQLFANVSGSYEPPSFGELAGGPNVTPVAAQRAKSIEVGTRGERSQAWGVLRWDLALYHARLKNELLTLNDAAGNPLGTTNAARTIHQGIEAGAEADIGRRWTLRLAYQLNDFRFDGDRAYGDNRLAGVPRHFATAEMLYRADNGLYFGPNLRAASSTQIDHANTLSAAGYGVIGFKVGQAVNKSLSWFIDARNLADKVYAATTNVIADARGLDGRYFYPGDGRSLYAGIELKY